MAPDPNSHLETFLNAVRAAAPSHHVLIDARAEALRHDPMQLLIDLEQRAVLPRHRLHQYWADTFGVAAINPTAVAISADGYEQLPVDIARRVQAIVISTIGDTSTVAMADP